MVGLNCSVGPKPTLETLERMMQHTKKPLSAMPRRGPSDADRGRNIYLSSPEYMAPSMQGRMLWAGVKIVGGCCGTTPEHIKAIASEARSLQPGAAEAAVPAQAPEAKKQALRRFRWRKSRLWEPKLRQENS